MELFEEKSSFDLSLFLNFQLTFPEREKERMPSQLAGTAAVLLPNRRQSRGRRTWEEDWLKMLPSAFLWALAPHRDKRTKVGLGGTLSGSLGLQPGNPSNPCKQARGKPATGITTASAWEHVFCIQQSNSDKNGKCKSHPAGILTAIRQTKWLQQFFSTFHLNKKCYT